MIYSMPKQFLWRNSGDTIYPLARIMKGFIPLPRVPVRKCEVNDGKSDLVCQRIQEKSGLVYILHGHLRDYIVLILYFIDFILYWIVLVIYLPYQLGLQNTPTGSLLRSNPHQQVVYIEHKTAFAGEAPVLENWGMWSTPSVSSLTWSDITCCPYLGAK